MGGRAHPDHEESAAGLCSWLIPCPPASRLMRWAILLDRQPEAPGDGFGCRQDGWRHAQEIVALGGGILHLDVVGNPFRVTKGQRNLVQRAARAPVKNSPAQFTDKAARCTRLRCPFVTRNGLP